MTVLASKRNTSLIRGTVTTGMVCEYRQNNTPMNGQFANEWATSSYGHLASANANEKHLWYYVYNI